MNKFKNGKKIIMTQEELEVRQIRETEALSEQQNSLYVELRQSEYPVIGDQLDMQYWDKINSTTVWKDTIQAVKEKYPKP